MKTLTELAAHIEKTKVGCNKTDVLVEIALFKPSRKWKSVRANDAGTKVIYTSKGGKQETFWARDWTLSRESTVAALRSRAAS